ncbi:MAG: hypothetical protein R3E12_20485 [Candidatus Eisenbacteria bacterium]
MEVDAHFEFGDDTLDEAASELDQVLRLDIDVHLSDGSSLQGTIAYVLPPAQRRLQDVLNFDERFLIVRDHDRVCFINRRHIVKASPKA